jgi:hypothetical protein
MGYMHVIELGKVVLDGMQRATFEVEIKGGGNDLGVRLHLQEGRGCDESMVTSLATVSLALATVRLAKSISYDCGRTAIRAK